MEVVEEEAAAAAEEDDEGSRELLHACTLQIGSQAFNTEPHFCFRSSATHTETLLLIPTANEALEGHLG